MSTRVCNNFHMETESRRTSDEPSAARRQRLEAAAAQHAELPAPIIAEQLARVEEALDLLGDNGELVDTAIDVVDTNLSAVEDARTNGAELAEPPEKTAD